MVKRKKRVFISFDFDNDKVLKDFLIGQSKLPDSPFEVSDWSLKEAAPEKNWEEKAREQGYKKPGEEQVVVLPPEEENQTPLEEEKSFWQRILEKLGF